MNDGQSLVGALVDFGNPNVGVFVYSNTEGENEKYGEILLYTTIILRMFSLGMDKKQKNIMFEAFYLGSAGLNELLPMLLIGYADYYKQDTPKIIYEASGKTKRGFELIIPYSNGLHGTKMTPRGFGILGRNIESGAYTAILLIHDFLCKKYKNNKKMLENINYVTKEASMFIMQNGGKVNAKLEFIASEEITSKYRHYIDN